MTSKKALPTSWSGQPHPPNEVSLSSNQKSKPLFFAESEIDDVSPWDECGREAKKNPAPSRSRGNTGGGEKKRGDREEVRDY